MKDLVLVLKAAYLLQFNRLDT